MENRIPVTRPFLPPIGEYEALLKDIWNRNWLTNDGPLVRELEEKLAQDLNVPHVIFVSNGTIALQIAMKAMGLKGEVLTTPFSYVATTSSLVWENLRPVYVDIDPETLTIDPEKLKLRLTSDTTAILATHVFGNPCEIDAIREFADRYSLKVIYDAAHAYGSRYNGKTVMKSGDITCVSFHATKLFHTVEGGAIITTDDDLAYRSRKMRNFGHNGPLKFDGIGINGKNSEFHAAMGLVNLKYMDVVIKRRQHQLQEYRDNLKDLPIEFPKVNSKAEDNSSYCAIIFKTEEDLLSAETALSSVGIGSRRYFYPSLNRLEYVRSQSCPISENLSKRILCLPVYHELSDEEISGICEIVKSSFSLV